LLFSSSVKVAIGIVKIFVMIIHVILYVGLNLGGNFGEVLKNQKSVIVNIYVLNERG